MIERTNITYICIFIFINSVLYSVFDLYTTDKLFNVSDYYIAIIFYFFYKIIPAFIIGNVKVQDSYHSKLILFYLNLIIVVLSLPTFYAVYINKNPNDISYFIHVCRELFNFFCIIIIIMNMMLKNHTLIAIINIIVGLIIFKSKIFLLMIFLFYVCIYIKNKHRVILILSILTALFFISYAYIVSQGSGRDSEINHIAYTTYSVNNYGSYNDDLFGNLIIHSVVPNMAYKYIYGHNKSFVNIDRKFSDYYGYPIEDFNTNPVIPFLFLYGYSGFIFFLFIYYFYLIILANYIKSTNNKWLSLFLLGSLIILIFKIELDLIILFQFIKWQIILLIILFLYKKCF